MFSKRVLSPIYGGQPRRMKYPVLFGILLETSWHITQRKLLHAWYWDFHFFMDLHLQGAAKPSYTEYIKTPIWKAFKKISLKWFNFHNLFSCVLRWLTHTLPFHLPNPSSPLQPWTPPHFHHLCCTILCNTNFDLGLRILGFCIAFLFILHFV